MGNFEEVKMQPLNPNEKMEMFQEAKEMNLMDSDHEKNSDSEQEMIEVLEKEG